MDWKDQLEFQLERFLEEDIGDDIGFGHWSQDHGCAHGRGWASVDMTKNPCTNAFVHMTLRAFATPRLAPHFGAYNYCGCVIQDECST